MSGRPPEIPDAPRLPLNRRTRVVADALDLPSVERKEMRKS